MKTNETHTTKTEKKSDSGKRTYGSEFRTAGGMGDEVPPFGSGYVPRMGVRTAGLGSNDSFLEYGGESDSIRQTTRDSSRSETILPTLAENRGLDRREDDRAIRPQYERPMTILEACEFLGVSRKTLMPLVRSGEIPSKLIGKRNYRFSKKLLTEWVDTAPVRVDPRKIRSVSLPTSRGSASRTGPTP